MKVKTAIPVWAKVCIPSTMIGLVLTLQIVVITARELVTERLLWWEQRVR